MSYSMTPLEGNVTIRIGRSSPGFVEARVFWPTNTEDSGPIPVWDPSRGEVKGPDLVNVAVSLLQGRLKGRRWLLESVLSIPGSIIISVSGRSERLGVDELGIISYTAHPTIQGRWVVTDMKGQESVVTGSLEEVHSGVINGVLNKDGGVWRVIACHTLDGYVFAWCTKKSVLSI